MSFMGDVMRETGIKIFSTILVFIIIIGLIFAIIYFVDWSFIKDLVINKVIDGIINGK